MIVVRAVVMGPNQPSGRKTQKKKDSASKVAPEPFQTIHQSFWFLVTGKIYEKELLPVTMGRKQLCF